MSSLPRYAALSTELGRLGFHSAAKAAWEAREPRQLAAIIDPSWGGQHPESTFGRATEAIRLAMRGEEPPTAPTEADLWWAANRPSPTAGWSRARANRARRARKAQQA